MLVSSFCFACGILIALGACFYRRPPDPKIGTYSAEPVPKRLVSAIAAKKLLEAANFPNFKHALDIGTFNIICSSKLPGAESLDFQTAEDQLNEWTSHVRNETNRNMHLFYENPSEYHNSETYFRVLTLILTLQKDYGIHPDPEPAKMPDFGREFDEWNRDSKNLFLVGFLNKERRCSRFNVPVLYVTIGRRLGYPMYLAQTRGHLFCRWEDKSGQHMNIEATSEGFVTTTDEQYKKWPTEVGDEEIKICGYLKSMEPMDEIVYFLTLRALVLTSNGYYAEAQTCLSYINCLKPDLPLYRQKLILSLFNQIPFWNKNLVPIDSTSMDYDRFMKTIDPKKMKVVR